MLQLCNVCLLMWVTTFVCLVTGPASAFGEPVRGLELVGAFHTANQPVRIAAPEGNDEIREAKESITDGGAYVRIYLRNNSTTPVGIEDIAWNGKTAKEHHAAHLLIWTRLRPDRIPPGGEGELTLCLRETLRDSVDVELTASQALHVTARVQPIAAMCRIATIVFDAALSQATIYLERQEASAKLPTELHLNGRRVTDHVTWLHDDFVRDTGVAVVNLPEGFERGVFYTFRFEAQGQTVAAGGLRAFGDLAVFGTYGGADFERYAANGLDAYNSFRRLSMVQLDQAQRLGVRTIPLVKGEPSPDTLRHPAIFAYGLVDEPDVKDHGVKDVPMRYRIGQHAPQVIAYEAGCRAVDAQTPTSLTINLTFTPHNYYIYCPISDIPNPDCYPLIAGWSIRSIRDNLANIRRASMPGPFTYTYQSGWEEYGINQNRYVSGREMLNGGFDAFRDPKRVRGFGRCPTPSEVRIQMLYAIGFGARGLFAWTDRTEMVGNLMFHGTDSLPDMWRTVGENSRELQMVAPLLNVSHPLQWASSSRETLWTQTLWAGQDAALVVVVNDNYTSQASGFEQSPVENAVISFPDLPWLNPDRVYRVADGNLESLAAAPLPHGGVEWTDTIRNGELYLVVRGNHVSESLTKRYHARANTRR